MRRRGAPWLLVLGATCRTSVEGLREAVRQTHLIDDFERWDDALHQAIAHFRSDYGLYPEVVSAHPESLYRFSMRADPSQLRDEDGRPPGPADLIGRILHIGKFSTDAYTVRFEPVPDLWPVEIVLWVAPKGAPRPEADTPPPVPLRGVETTPEAPVASRPAHAPLLFLAERCTGCRHLLTLRSCRAFPGGIPLPIAQSRHDHVEPFPGDGGLRFEPSTDDAQTSKVALAFLFGDHSARLDPEDAPRDPFPLLRVPGPVGDDACAPEMPTAQTVRRRARLRLARLAEEAGGVEAIEPVELAERFRRAYPVTRAMLEHFQRRPDGWRAYVDRWHRRERAKRDRLSSSRVDRRGRRS